MYHAVHGPEPRTPEEVAHDFEVPLEAVLEALDYVERNPAIIQADREREESKLRPGPAGRASAVMRFLIDENREPVRSVPGVATPSPGARSRPGLDVGLLSIADPRVLAWAIGQGLPVLTRDFEDFEDLHILVMAADGHHPGMLIVRFDADPRNNMSDRTIGVAIGKLESAGVPLPDLIHVLNQWR